MTPELHHGAIRVAFVSIFILLNFLISSHEYGIVLIIILKTLAFFPLDSKKKISYSLF